MKIFRRITPIAFVVLVVFQGCKDEPVVSPAMNGDIQGLAVDEQGFVIPNANVEVLNSSSELIASDVSDDLGTFLLTNVPLNQPVLIRVTHEDFKEFTKNYVNLDNEGPMIMLPMTHVDSACGSIRLLVRDIVSLNAISGAEVRLLRNTHHVTTTATDSNGRTSFDNVIAGQYRVRISMPGYQTIERDAGVHFCDSTFLDVRMTPTTHSQDTCCHGNITVLITDSLTNAPVAGTVLKLFRSNTLIESIQTDQQGLAHIDALCEGDYNLHVVSHTYVARQINFSLGCNESRTISLALFPNPPDTCCTAALAIVVVDSTQHSVKIADATVTISLNNNVIATGTTGHDGGYQAGHLCSPATYNVLVSKAGFQPKSLAVTFNACKTITMTVLLSP